MKIICILAASDCFFEYSPSSYLYVEESHPPFKKENLQQKMSHDFPVYKIGRNFGQCCSSEEEGSKPLKILSRSLTLTAFKSDLELSKHQQKWHTVDRKIIELYVKKSHSSPSVDVSTGRSLSVESFRTAAGSPGSYYPRESGGLSRLEGSSSAPHAFDPLEIDEPQENRRSSVRFAPESAYTGPQYQTAVPDSNCYKVLEFLFLSGISAAVNAQLLCKLKIEYLLDCSGTDPQHMPPDLRSSCPCLCLSPTGHSRVQMALEIDQTTSPAAVVECFTEVNRFIASARANKKRVLIFSYEGNNRAPTLAIQYIMSYYNIPFRKAKSFLDTSCPNVALSANFEDALKQWEKMLSPKPPAPASSNSTVFRSSPTPNPTPDTRPSSKNAWLDD